MVQLGHKGQQEMTEQTERMVPTEQSDLRGRKDPLVLMVQSVHKGRKVLLD
jgi:hypothetical protein